MEHNWRPKVEQSNLLKLEELMRTDSLMLNIIVHILTFSEPATEKDGSCFQLLVLTPKEMKKHQNKVHYSNAICSVYFSIFSKIPGFKKMPTLRR